MLYLRTSLYKLYKCAHGSKVTQNMVRITQKLEKNYKYTQNKEQNVYAKKQCSHQSKNGDIQTLRNKTNRIPKLK